MASSSEYTSGSESSSEEEAPRPLMMRPKFIPKSQRNKQAQAVEAGEPGEPPLSPNSRRLAAANVLVEEQIKKDLAARATVRKHWESDSDHGDDSDAPSDVDTTDGLDPEAEEAAWRLRELKRVRRTRDAIEEKERELAEVERRRNLTQEERAAEDDAHIARQREEKDGRGKMAYMQKYFHSGAFYRDDGAAAGVLQRDLMGTRIADDIRDRSVLPEYLQRRDMTKLGRKGASKYRDMRSEDTGAWGVLNNRRGRGGEGGTGGGFGDRGIDIDDERFRPDWDGHGGGKGANAMPLGERRAGAVGDSGNGGDRAGDRNRSRDGGRDRDRNRDRDSYRDRDEGHRRPRSPSRSRSRSPRRRGDGGRSPRRHGRSPERGYRDRDDYKRRKRSTSRDRYESDKRRRVDVR